MKVMKVMKVMNVDAKCKWVYISEGNNNIYYILYYYLYIILTDSFQIQAKCLQSETVFTSVEVLMTFMTS